MKCFHPVDAYQHSSGGKLVFEEKPDHRFLQIRCGQCTGCRLNRSREWAVRVLHESQLYDASSFVTLTYDDDHLPVDNSLRYRDFQLFMKKLRKSYASRRQRIRFYCAGEYGDNFQRPHFHAILFGVFFHDRQFLKNMPSGSRLYSSKTLEDVWSRGYVSVGDVTFESAAYVARYCMKKVTGDKAHEHYKMVSEDGEIYWRTPEFNRMSLKPGIGADWWKKYKKEVLVRDACIIDGKEVKVPKFYDRLLEQFDGLQFDDVKYERMKKALEFAHDNTPERLRVQEVVANSKLAFKPRTLE